ncbi:MAG: glycosyltransferase family 4 protein [Elusimicrobia bacterium]|nr:glycosyltransferase family 4 protein [Elusimicrobiota bacterium]MBI4217849.1 glycosyltransferase family 4 protein [Elusimicrobiota bacterium]
MKIFHMLDIPWWSGLTRYAFDIIQANLNSGHRVTVACQKGALPYRKSYEMGLRATPILGREPQSALINFFLLGSALRKEKPDWIVAHTGSTHWIGLWWGKRMGIPALRVRATSQKLKTSFLNRKVYQSTHGIVAASRKLREECLPFFLDGDGSHVKVIYPPVDSLPAANAGGPSGRKKIGIVARLDPVKGYFTFLKAAKEIQKKHPETEFHVAGAEENLSWNEILRESKSLGLKSLKYHGFLGEKEVAAFMQDCVCGLLTSTGSEEVSRALLEWMSCGKAVVATQVGCVAEILKDGEGGFLVSANDSESIAQKVNLILESPDISQKMGEFNRAQVLKDFNREKFRREWEEILSEP